jgi:hypothetical protein
LEAIEVRLGIYREDISEWFNALFDRTDITQETLMADLASGVLLCQLARKINEAVLKGRSAADAGDEEGVALANIELTEGVATRQLWAYKQPPSSDTERLAIDAHPRYKDTQKQFHIRDNVSNFIVWATGRGVPCVFETSDLTLRRNDSHVLNCLMDVARGGRNVLEHLPTLIRFEKQIDESPALDGADGARVVVEGDQGVELQEHARLQTPQPEKETLVKSSDKNSYEYRGLKLFIRCFNRHVVVRYSSLPSNQGPLTTRCFNRYVVVRCHRSFILAGGLARGMMEVHTALLPAPISGDRKFGGTKLTPEMNLSEHSDTRDALFLG